MKHQPFAPVGFHANGTPDFTDRRAWSNADREEVRQIDASARLVAVLMGFGLLAGVIATVCIVWIVLSHGAEHGARPIACAHLLHECAAAVVEARK